MKSVTWEAADSHQKRVEEPLPGLCCLITEMTVFRHFEGGSWEAPRDHKCSGVSWHGTLVINMSALPSLPWHGQPASSFFPVPPVLRPDLEAGFPPAGLKLLA